jgi:hypothetical protein
MGYKPTTMADLSSREGVLQALKNASTAEELEEAIQVRLLLLTCLTAMKTAQSSVRACFLRIASADVCRHPRPSQLPVMQGKRLRSGSCSALRKMRHKVKVP